MHGLMNEADYSKGYVPPGNSCLLLHDSSESCWTFFASYNILHELFIMLLQVKMYYRYRIDRQFVASVHYQFFPIQI